MTEYEDFYEVLGVFPDASRSDIAKAYRKLMIEHHPDTAGPGHEDDVSRFSRAWEVLGDERRRAEYDRERMAAQQPSAATSARETRGGGASPVRLEGHEPSKVTSDLDMWKWLLAGQVLLVGVSLVRCWGHGVGALLICSTAGTIVGIWRNRQRRVPRRGRVLDIAGAVAAAVLVITAARYHDPAPSWLAALASSWLMARFWFPSWHTLRDMTSTVRRKDLARADLAWGPAQENFLEDSDVITLVLNRIPNARLVRSSSQVGFTHAIVAGTRVALLDGFRVTSPSGNWEVNRYSIIKDGRTVAYDPMWEREMSSLRKADTDLSANAFVVVGGGGVSYPSADIDLVSENEAADFITAWLSKPPSKTVDLRTMVNVLRVI